VEDDGMAWLGEEEEAAAERDLFNSVTGEGQGVPAAVAPATVPPAAGATTSTGGGAGEADLSGGGGVPAATNALDDDEEGLDWLKEASILDDGVPGAAGDLGGLELGGGDDDVPDWLKD
jgi:hypothetical protein